MERSRKGWESDHDQASSSGSVAFFAWWVSGVWFFERSSARSRRSIRKSLQVLKLRQKLSPAIVLDPAIELRVTVFRHEDLSGEFQLDGEGYFALPLVGEIKGGGKVARELENDIETAFKEGGYLVSPQVSLEVLNYRPFYILGEVNQPGSYPYVNGMTVINAVALAGGYTYRASQGSISVQRGGSNGKKTASGWSDHAGASR